MNASYIATTEAMRAQLAMTYGFDRLCALDGVGEMLHADLLGAVLDEAARFSGDQLAPFDQKADRAGCLLKNGRVELAPGHRELWVAFREAGWTGIDTDVRFGGQGFPSAAAIPVQELFDRGSVSFGMAAGSARSAARLLASCAEPAIADRWVPRLADGTWGATICISEPDAGSDVGRVRTGAHRTIDGAWRVTGEKIWISYGDHDLNDRIGHLVLARTDGAATGTRGLSLFLVSSTIDGANGSFRRNTVVVRRIEEKLGLHASPTCALGFEDAEGELIGAEGLGLAQLFQMIVAMRLSVGTQGLGLATACLVAAADYAAERRQGGRFDQPPIPIDRHRDVQLMLVAMASRIATLRSLVYTAAVAADLADLDSDEIGRTSWSSLLGWLLPIVKNSGAETAVDIANEAVLVFGGAAYTVEWPIERHLRDARILAIYEGTTGMQAIDLVKRRWLTPDTGYEAFVAVAAQDAASSSPGAAEPLRRALTALADATAWLRDAGRTSSEIDAGARSALAVATIVAHAWAAARLIDGTDKRLAACGRAVLSLVGGQLAAASLAMRSSAERVAAYADLTAPD